MISQTDKVQHRLCLNVTLMLVFLTILVGGFIYTREGQHNARHRDAEYEISFLTTRIQALEMHCD